MHDGLDDFAGPGGWDEGAAMIGLRLLGVEWDAAACATAEAAGHARVKADVSTHQHDGTGLRRKLYVGSPPCTLFSSAGSGVGRLVLDALAAGIRRIFRGEDPDTVRQEVRDAIYPVTLAEAETKNAKRSAEKQWSPERVAEKARSDAFVAALVLEPARRIVQMDPDEVALEQVPEVLPLWQVYVHELRARGYSAWSAILNAADYGVPQTRRRALVGASRLRVVAPPVPTHSEHGDDGDLFGEGRARWISMAAALGIEHPTVRTGQNSQLGGGRSKPYDRSTDRPAPTVMQNGKSWRMGDVRGRNGTVRDADQPAPTLTASMDNGNFRFVSAGVTGEGRPRAAHQPAATITGAGNAYWIHERPSTTIVGSFRPDVVSAPGYRTSESRQDAEGSVLVTVTQAGVLQSFPASYPWQGYAVPPILAAHVLAAVTGVAL